MQTKRNMTGVLKEYFGYQPGQTLRGFAEEVRKLSDEEKLELARGAAKNLNLTQDDVEFPLAL